MSEHLRVQPELECANHRAKAVWDPRKVRYYLNAALLADLDLVSRLVRLLGLMDELDPKEKKAELLVSLVQSNLFEEATRARLRIICGLYFRVKRS